VRGGFPDQPHELPAVTGLSHHVESGAGEQVRQPLADEYVVVSNDHPPLRRCSVVAAMP
jgi:hypothetical protein